MIYGRDSIDRAWNVVGMFAVLCLIALGVWLLGGGIWHAITPTAFGGYYPCGSTYNGKPRYSGKMMLHHDIDPLIFTTFDYKEFRDFWDSLPDEHKIHNIKEPIEPPPDFVKEEKSDWD